MTTLLEPLSDICVLNSYKPAKVFLACPSYEGHTANMVVSCEACLSPGDDTLVFRKFRMPYSLLAMGFNDLWCQALNSHKEVQWDYFAMMHADIVGQPGWLTILIDELERTGSDLMSAVVSIKDDGGDTSTALYHTPSKHMTRLTLSELRTVPLTFDETDLERPHPSEEYKLCVNTGLWVCKFDKLAKAFKEGKPAPFWFEIRDNIVWDEEKKEWQARNMPEDWLFSLMLLDKGYKVMATRKAVVDHFGLKAFSNQ